MCLFVHAVGTSTHDAGARRRHTYARKCSQCGEPLTDSNKVAAHMVAHPCGNPCFGVLTLRTTCKRCNAQCTTTTKKKKRARGFWGLSLRMVWLRRIWCHSACDPYDARDAKRSENRAGEKKNE